VVLNEPRQERAQRAALGGGQRLEQRTLRRLDLGVELLQRGGWVRRELDQVATPVARVAAARDEPLALKVVHDAVQVAAIHPDAPPELRLAERPLLVQCRQHRVVGSAQA
jgi:hypothetical protein